MGLSSKNSKKGTDMCNTTANETKYFYFYDMDPNKDYYQIIYHFNYVLMKILSLSI